MDSLNSLIDGFGTALTPMNLLWAAIGVLLGTAIGVLPGIGPAMAVALLLPVTYGLDPTGAFIMFAGIYYGAMFGGSTTSILLNTPGESAAVVAAIEGNPMAKGGRGAQALAAAAIGHFAGGMIGTILLVVLAPTVASLAIGIGAPDYFAIMVLAFIAVTSVLGASRIRGIASLLIGLTIGLVGLDQMTGQQRLTFGSLHLADGVDVVIVAVGLFAIGEALWVAAHLRRSTGKPIPVEQALARPGRSEAHLETLAARARHRLPVRGDPGGWCGDPHLPQLRHREAALQAPRPVRQGRHRRRRRTRGRRLRLRRRDPRLDAHTRTAHHRRRRRDAGRLPAVRNPARPAALRA